VTDSLFTLEVDRVLYSCIFAIETMEQQKRTKKNKIPRVEKLTAS